VRRRSELTRRDLLTGAFRRRQGTPAADRAVDAPRAFSRARGDPHRLRPPGAREEGEFLARCTVCGDCVEACPFDTLALAGSGAERVPGAPYFEARRNPCFLCDDAPCIASCPTGALDKRTAIADARMGLAVLVAPESCLASRGQDCEACYRACPLTGRALRLELQAARSPENRARFRPLVDADHCTGCGRCEHACILDEAATRVLPTALARPRAEEEARPDAARGTRRTVDFTAPQRGPDHPSWASHLDAVLRDMNDLTGIEEP